MNRRDFLKETAGLSLAGLATLVWPVSQLSALTGQASMTVQAQAKGRLLRGTRDGLILESVDGGQTWQKVANFGKHCSIMAIRVYQGQIYTEVAVLGYPFTLQSADARLWRTTS
jgi:hypothetical protein